MRVAKREVNRTLILDLEGPFPDSDEDSRATQEAFCDALAGQSNGFIIVFHEIDFLRSVDVGVLLSWLRSAEAQVGALGTEPRIRIVSESERVRSDLSIVDSPFMLFATEEEALSFARNKSRGCLAALFFFLAVTFVLMFAMLA